MSEQTSEDGKPFWACERNLIKKCDFITWDVPTKEVCPECGKALELSRWVNQGDRRYMTLGACAEHGKFLIRLKFRKTEDESWAVNRIVYRADESMEKYYRDKSTQSRRRGRGRRRDKRTTAPST